MNRNCSEDSQSLMILASAESEVDVLVRAARATT